MTEWVMSLTLVLIAAACVARLPTLHPAQLWSVPWAVASVLFSLRLLPYRESSWSTAAVIVGASLSFVGCACLPIRLVSGRAASQVRRFEVRRTGSVPVAAAIALALLGAMLAAYLAHVTFEFGLRAAIVSSPDVRRAIGAGELGVTIKYVYFALVAAILCSVAAARSDTHGKAWLGAAGAASLSTYFSTGRSTVVVAALMAGLAYAVSTDHRLPLGRAIALASATVALALASFTLGGALIGKTLANSEVSTIDSVFTRNPVLEPLALPYQYATAPIAALNELVAADTEHGRADGCATLVLACTLSKHAGLPAEPESVIRSFTRPPLAWNTYTALDAPLIDWGLLAVVPVMALTGLFAGVAWALAQSGSVSGAVAHAVLGTAAAFSTVQYNFLAYHFVAAILISLALLVAATAERRLSVSGMAN